MLEQLFGSKTRLKLLRTFFHQPEEAFYVRELSRLLGVQINAIRRELELLIKSGLVKEAEKNGDFDQGKAGRTLRKYYTLNQESILCEELQALLVKDQVLGKQKFVAELQKKGGKIKLLLLTGHFTGDKKAPSDLLLVGSVKPRTVALLIAKYEKEFGFEVRYTTMTEKEFSDRRQVMDKFLYALFEAKHMKVVDQLN